MTTDCVEEIDAQRVQGYALFKDGKTTKLPYPLEKFHSDVAGRSFHNGRFIQRMREKASSLPKYTLCFPFLLFLYYPSFLVALKCSTEVKLTIYQVNLQPYAA